jgi:hypothetical protein
MTKRHTYLVRIHHLTPLFFCGVECAYQQAKYYELTRAGRKRVGKETQEWERMTGIVARFLTPKRGLA